MTNEKKTNKQINITTLKYQNEIILFLKKKEILLLILKCRKKSSFSKAIRKFNTVIFPMFISFCILFKEKKNNCLF